MEARRIGDKWLIVSRDTATVRVTVDDSSTVETVHRYWDGHDWTSDPEFAMEFPSESEARQRIERGLRA